MRIAALAGGVGAAKFLAGLARLVPEEDLSITVNTGDDIELFGLHISPDIDIVTYTLADIVDKSKGWGVSGDSFHCLENLKVLGEDTWFNVGDRDLATHLYRTQHLRSSVLLSEVTADICHRLGLKSKIFPMTDDKFETRIITPRGSVHFEEYFVKGRCQDEVLGVEYVGQETASPAPCVLEAILRADLVVVCPSNPIVSIGTILAVKGVRDALKNTDAFVVGVSPIVGGVALKGPADVMMRSLGFEVSSFGVAKLYCDFLDAIVIDLEDTKLKERIQELGLGVVVTNTVMKSMDDKMALAKSVLEAKRAMHS